MSKKIKTPDPDKPLRDLIGKAKGKRLRTLQEIFKRLDRQHDNWSLEAKQQIAAKMYERQFGVTTEQMTTVVQLSIQQMTPDEKAKVRGHLRRAFGPKTKKSYVH